MKKEYILCSALWFKEVDSEVHETVKKQSRPINVDTGVVFCGHRHLQCLRSSSYITGKQAKDNIVGETVQGFLTSKNRFVDREEGGQIAFSAGQTQDLKITLYSEDLW